ncbi:collagen alpha-2(XI) chain-like [Sorex araneus]|uniref:collagen alpha-2(XI) chain-like n=1 Tax=Sorex araneus TaxID=42254 RepID=UPI002433BCD9|nr:collagen alpha-2(XI) chain-like [Sorex araneus]
MLRAGHMPPHSWGLPAGRCPQPGAQTLHAVGFSSRGFPEQFFCRVLVWLLPEWHRGPRLRPGQGPSRESLAPPPRTRPWQQGSLWGRAVSPGEVLLQSPGTGPPGTCCGVGGQGSALGARGEAAPTGPPVLAWCPVLAVGAVEASGVTAPLGAPGAGALAEQPQLVRRPQASRYRRRSRDPRYLRGDPGPRQLRAAPGPDACGRLDPGWTWAFPRSGGHTAGCGSQESLPLPGLLPALRGRVCRRGRASPAVPWTAQLWAGLQSRGAWVGRIGRGQAWGCPGAPGHCRALWPSVSSASNPGLGRCGQQRGCRRLWTGWASGLLTGSGAPPPEGSGLG